MAYLEESNAERHKIEWWFRVPGRNGLSEFHGDQVSVLQGGRVQDIRDSSQLHNNVNAPGQVNWLKW